VVPCPSLLLTDFPQRRKGRGRDWRPLQLVRLQCYLGRRTNLRDSRQENGSSSCLCNLIPSFTTIDDVESFVELCLLTRFSTPHQLKDVLDRGNHWPCFRITALRGVAQAHPVCGDPGRDFGDAQEFPMGILPLLAQRTRLCSCK
jgi:hypothetical protein